VKKAKTEAEILIDYHLQDLQLLPFVCEYEFFKGRKWRFDRAVMNGTRLAVEIEGGIWVEGGGGHNRGRDFQDDLDKYNAAASIGWTVFRFSCEDISFGRDLEPLKRYIDYKAGTMDVTQLDAKEWDGART
jgi:hypothetical protein